MRTSSTVAGVLSGAALLIAVGCTGSLGPEYASLRVVVRAQSVEFDNVVTAGQQIRITVNATADSGGTATYTIAVIDISTGNSLATATITDPAPLGVTAQHTGFGEALRTIQAGENSVTVYVTWTVPNSGATLDVIVTDLVAPSLDSQIVTPAGSQTVGQPIGIQVWATNYNGANSALTVTVALVNLGGTTVVAATLTYSSTSDSFSGSVSTAGLPQGDYRLSTTVTSPSTPPVSTTYSKTYALTAP